MTIAGNFTSGRTVINSNNETTSVYDPATGKAIYEVAVSTMQEVSEAIQIAHDTFDSQSRTTPLHHVHVLFDFRVLLGQHAEELTGITVNERDRVRSGMLGESTRGMKVVGSVYGIPRLIKSEYSSDIGAGTGSYSPIQPLDVVTRVTPLSFSAIVPMQIFPLALAYDNGFTLKPPALVPATVVHLAELLREADPPDGVFNIMHCSNEDAKQLHTDPRITAVSFVGSPGVTEYIYKTISAHGKYIQIFGAAKNHATVMPDANLDVIVNAIMGGAFSSAGERCMALSMVVAVGDEAAGKLIAHLKPLVEALRVGPSCIRGQEKDGVEPVVSGARQKKVLDCIDKGEGEGAKLIVDNRKLRVPGYDIGYYVGGTLSDRVTSEIIIWCGEIFGPVLGVVHAAGYDNVLELVNGREFDNSSAVFTSNGHTVCEFVHGMQAGVVGVGVPVPVPMVFHSFGGWKCPAFGVSNIHGPDGMRFYTRMKIATVR